MTYKKRYNLDKNIKKQEDVKKVEESLISILKSKNAFMDYVNVNILTLSLAFFIYCASIQASIAYVGINMSELSFTDSYTNAFWLSMALSFLLLNLLFLAKKLVFKYKYKTAIKAAEERGVKTKYDNSILYLTLMCLGCASSLFIFIQGSYHMYLNIEANIFEFFQVYDVSTLLAVIFGSFAILSILLMSHDFKKYDKLYNVKKWNEKNKNVK